MILSSAYSLMVATYNYLTACGTRTLMEEYGMLNQGCMMEQVYQRFYGLSSVDHLKVCTVSHLSSMITPAVTTRLIVRDGKQIG